MNDKVFKLTVLSLIGNISYSLYNIALGAVGGSWWFLALGAYYATLSVMRFSVLRKKEIVFNTFAKRTAILFIVLITIPLAGTVVLAFLKDRGIYFDKIAMITIALYTFIKVTLATVNLAKAKKNTSLKLQMLRNISFADALVSIFSLQRSMLVSFKGMDESTVRVMNIITGSAVCVTVVALGILFIYKADSAHKKS